MSNLLLLGASALAQTSGCEPDPSRLVALPGPGEVDVPPGISPFILFDDPCQVDLRVEVTEAMAGFPSVTDVALRANYATSWLLTPDTEYEVSIFSTESEALITSWSFTTGTREPHAIRSPSVVDLYAWAEEVDGQLTQFVDYSFNIVESDAQGILQLHTEDGRRLYAASHSDTDRHVSTEPLSFEIGFSQSEVCLYLVETDEQGTGTSRLECTQNLDSRDATFDRQCSTAPGAGWLAWLPLLALSRRRARS